MTPPETDPTEAAPLLVHTPPGEELLKMMVVPGHSELAPVIGGGGGETVTVTVVRQPVLSV